MSTSARNGLRQDGLQGNKERRMHAFRKPGTMATSALLVATTSACRHVPPPHAILSTARFTDAKARRQMATEDVKGMALAVIDDQRVMHVAAFAGRKCDVVVVGIRKSIGHAGSRNEKLAPYSRVAGYGSFQTIPRHEVMP